MLTEKRIAKLKTKRGRYSAGEVKGLCLQVTKVGVTSWLLRYEIAGRERSMGLGPYPLFKLKEARERARAARKLIADGIDPLEAKAQAKQAAALEKAKTVTFKQVAQEYYDATKASWRSARTGAQFQSSLKAYVLPVIGSLPVSEIDKALVLKVIRPEWDTKNRDDGQSAQADRERDRLCRRLWLQAAGPEPCNMVGVSGARAVGAAEGSTDRPPSRIALSGGADVHGCASAMRGRRGACAGVYDPHLCENWRNTGGEVGAN